MPWFSKEKIPFLLLLLTFIFESIGAQFTYLFGHSYGLSFILKSFIFVYMIALSVRYYIKIYAYLGILLLLFSISQFTYPQFEFDILKNFQMFINYIYLFVLVMGLSKLISQSNAAELQQLYLWGTLILLGSIIFGALLNVSSFTTYTNRFGFKGLIPTAATVSYFIILCWIVFLQKEWQNKKSYFFLLILTLATFLAGTKAAILFLVFVLLHLLIYRRMLLQSWKFTAGGIGLLVFLVVIFQAYKDKFLATKDIFSKLYSEENIFSAISSFRTRKLMDYSSYYADHWEPINYFIGGRHVFIDNFELDFIDLLLHFGIIGSIIYAFVFLKLIYPLIDKNQRILFIGLLVIASLAGQLFYNTYIHLMLAYFLLLRQYLNTSNKKT